MDWFLLAKVLHFLALISWFAGLFYFPRLLIYQLEALERGGVEGQAIAGQLALMQERLYRIIMRPAFVLTFVAGLAMIGIREYQTGGGYLLHQWWLQLKFVLVVFLGVYHVYCGRLMRLFGGGQIENWTTYRLRLFNEVPTVLMLGIVLLAVYKNILNVFWAFAFVLIFGFILSLGVRWYRLRRLAGLSK